MNADGDRDEEYEAMSLKMKGEKEDLLEDEGKSVTVSKLIVVTISSLEFVFS